MARASQKATLSPSRDLPFDKLVLSQSNVRRTKAGVPVEELAKDIARRGLLHGLNARPWSMPLVSRPARSEFRSAADAFGRCRCW